MSITVPNIYYGKRQGTFRISEDRISWDVSAADAASAAAAAAGGSAVSIVGSSITGAEWLYVARGWQLRVWQETEAAEFTGFAEGQYAQLNSAVQQCSGARVELVERVERNVSGINWGDLDFHSNGNYLVYQDAQGNRIFDIPLAQIKNCSKQAKNTELILEFFDGSEGSGGGPAGSDAAGKNDDALVELRFAFPKDEASAGNGGDDDDVDEATMSRVERLSKQIMSRTEGAQGGTGDVVVSFQEMPFVVPRGRYTLDLSRKVTRLHGKTYDFKIAHSNVSVMFLLPRPDGGMYFVLALEQPVRTGKAQPQQYLVLQFDGAKKLDEPKIINMPSDEIVDKYASKGLKKEMDGLEFETVAKVFRALSGKKLIGPGKFTLSDGTTKALKCNVKAEEGYLYVLEKSFLFLHKPTHYIRHEEIKRIIFERTDGGMSRGQTRTFDLSFQLHSGGKKITFSNIAKSEYDVLVKYLQEKELNVENLIAEADAAVAAAHAMLNEGEDESEDEDFDEGDDGEGDDEDFDQFVEGGDMIDADELAHLQEDADTDAPVAGSARKKAKLA